MAGDGIKQLLRSLLTQAMLWFWTTDWPDTALVFLQVARKLVILEGELERAEERAEVSEVWVTF